MKKLLFAYCVLTSLSWNALGQASTCVQTLRMAQSTYESGRLHELPSILKNCLRNGFTDEEKRQAYKLLAQSYIYLEEPESADSAMLNLLRTDHFFEINEDVDPAEFVSLYNKFRTQSLFRGGVKIGPTFNTASPMSDSFIGAASSGTGSYSLGVGFNIGLVFEKDFFPSKVDAKGAGRFTIAPEANFAIRSFKETSTQFIKDGVTGDEVIADSEEKIKLSWIEVNPLVKFRIPKREQDGRFEPFLVGGPGVNLVLKAQLTNGQLNRNDGAGTVTGAAVNIKDSFRPLNFSAIVGAGAKVRVGGIFITGDVRVQYGLSNLIDPSSRTNSEAAFDYSYVPNDSRLNSIMINLGVQYAYFNPKKLIK